MQDDELKPCPYCNNTVIELWEDEDGETLYCCESCGLCSLWSENAIDVIQKWNSLLRQSYAEQLKHSMMELQQVQAKYKELENRYKDVMQSLFSISMTVRRAVCQKKN